MALDLRPYGLNWTLDPKTMTTKFIPDSPTYAEAIRSGDKISIMIGTQEKKFRISGKKLGSGSYGVTYPLEDLNGDPTPKVVKVMSKELNFKSDPAKYLREAIIQIIIEKETENESYPEINLYGPFAPRLFYIGVEKTEYYIISERLTNTLLANMKSDKLDEYKTHIVKIAKILQVLYAKLRFNHRDLKFDNIMYTLNPNNTENIKLIDFGFSCLKYKGIQISNNTEKLSHCYKMSRDMSSIFYYIINFTLLDKSSYLYRIIDSLLNSQSGYAPENWRNTYSTYNSIVDYANLYPEVIYTIFSNIDSTNSNTWVKYLDEINIKLLHITTTEEFANFQMDKLVKFICENKVELNILRLPKILTLFDYAESSSTPEAEKLFNYMVTTEQEHDNLLEIMIDNNKIELFTKIVQKLKYRDKTIFHRIIKIDAIPIEYINVVVQLPNSHTIVNTPNSLGKTTLECVIAKQDIDQIMWFLNFPGINLQFLESTALIEAILQIDVGDIELVVDKILELNKTPGFINYVAKGKPALQLAIDKRKYVVINKLLSIENINVRFTHSTVLIELIKRFPEAPPGLYIANIPKSQLTPEYLSFNNSYALLTAAMVGNLEVCKFLVEAGSEIPRMILSYLTRAKKPLIDYFFSIASKPEYINAIYTVNDEFKNYSVLMLAVRYSNLYLVSRLLEFPYLKTAYKNPADGKTALHYAAKESMNVPGNSTIKSLSEAPAHQILKLLIDRNPALPEIKNSSQKGPGNPSYVGTGFTRTYIKSRKSGLFGKKHANTNMAGGTRKHKIKQCHKLHLRTRGTFSRLSKL